MNRAQRRVSRKQFNRQKAGPVENFRVQSGHLAMTFDVEGYDPSTSQIPVSELTDVVARVGEVLGSRSYQDALKMFGEAFRSVKSGNDEAVEGTCLPGGGSRSTIPRAAQ